MTATRFADRMATQGAGASTVLWMIASVIASALITINSSLSSSIIVLIAISPIWVRDIGRDRWQRWSVAWFLILLASGEILVGLARFYGRVVHLDLKADSTWTLASFFALFCVLRVVSRRLPVHLVTVSFALGRIIGLAQSGINTSNVWKYNLSLPVAVIVLSIAITLTARRIVSMSVAALAALAAVSVLLDYRSLAAMCVLAALLIVVARAGLSRARNRRRSHDLLYAAVIVVALLIINQVGTDAALNGLLGSGIQARSVYQFDATGSLLSGARPEWFATFALMGQNIFGFGPGTSANAMELGYAFQALDAVRIGSSNPYVQVYLFGSGVELHSVIGDFWARYGIPGLVFALSITIFLARTLIADLRKSVLTGLSALVLIWAIWSMLFGPIFTDSPLIILAIVVASRPAPIAERLGTVR